jgi:hypothetical protein
MKIIEHEGIKYPIIIDLNAMEDFQKSFLLKLEQTSQIQKFLKTLA